MDLGGLAGAAEPPSKRVHRRVGINVARDGDACARPDSVSLAIGECVAGRSV